MNGDQILYATIVAVPTAGIGILTYLQSKKKDTVTEQSGIVSSNRADTALLIQGLYSLLDNVQEDNAQHRADRVQFLIDIRECAARLEKCNVERLEAGRERDEIRLELAQHRQKYGNGG